MLFFSHFLFCIFYKFSLNNKIKKSSLCLSFLDTIGILINDHVILYQFYLIFLPDENADLN